MEKLKMYICNASSFSMLDRRTQAGQNPLENPRTPRPVEAVQVAELMKFIKAGKIEVISAVGYTDTATLFSVILGIPLEVNRISVKLAGCHERALIGQVMGGRLPEGCTTLPDRVVLEWWII